MNAGFIDRYGMLPKGIKVLCAVSGGADSVYLLCRMLELSAERGIEVCAAHYNHCLRGAESDRDEAFVKTFCAGRGVPFAAGRGDVTAYAADNGMGTEEAARRLRYAFLERAAEEMGADKIATAHTADDNAETVLLNLARGAGLRGMCGIPPVREKLIRPMLMTTRAEVEAYLEKNGVAHVEDSTNESDDYARNRLRHEAVPALRSVNAAFSSNVSKTAALLREDEAFLVSLAKSFIDANLKDDRLPAQALSALSGPVSARAVRLLCGGAVSEKHVEAVLKLARGDGLGYADVPGMRVLREQGFLRFGGAEPGKMIPTAIAIGERIRIPGTDLTAECALIPDCPEIHSSLNTFFFKYENIRGIISCTSRADGDRIRLAGRGCTKRLSDLFTEKKLTQERRDLTPVLRDGDGIVAVYGFGVAERCAAEPGDTVLKIDIKSGENI